MLSYRDVIANEHCQRQHASDQDSDRAAVKIEAGRRQFGVPIKVPQPADLGPSRINPHSDYRQKQIDDPDAEIFRATAGESKWHRRKGSLRWRFGLRDLIHGANSLGVAREPIAPLGDFGMVSGILSPCS